MDEEQKAAAEAAEAAKLEAEKQAAEKTALNNLDGTTNGTSDDDKSGAGVEKKDYSSMSEEQIIADLKEKHKDATPEQLMSELAKKMQIIGHKNRAIDSLKKPKDDVVVPKKEDLDDLDKPITRRELAELNNAKTIEQMASQFTSDQKEKEEIIKAYKNDIVKSGDIALDFKKSLAIANAGVVEEYKKNQTISKNNENFLTNFSGGQSSGSSFGNSSPNDAIKNAIIANLQKADYSKEEIDKAISKL